MSDPPNLGAREEAARVFVSYAREDRRWLDVEYQYNLVPFLRESLRRNNVTFWFDKELSPGDEFRQLIETEIDRSQIALLLVSQSFLNSEFIEKCEMPRITQRAQQRQIIVVPVLVEPCGWTEYPFLADRQMIPGSKALIYYTERESDWAAIKLEILDGIKAQLRKIRKTVAIVESKEPDNVAPPTIPIVAPRFWSISRWTWTGGAVISALVLVAGFVNVWHLSQARISAPQVVYKTVPGAPVNSAPTGTLVIQGSVDKGTPNNVQVFVDGALKGFTLGDGSLKLPVDPGRHSVQFAKPGYGEGSAVSVNVATNAQQDLSFKLTQSAAAMPQQSVAYVSILSLPGATVAVDNVAKGITDTHGLYVAQVRPGAHAVQISLSGYQPVTKSLDLENGAQMNVSAALSPIQAIVAPPQVQPVSAIFSSSASTIQQGQSTTLKWQTSNANDISIDNGIGGVGASGQRDVSPSATTTYNLTARGSSGIEQSSITITVLPKAGVARPAPSAVPAAAGAALIQQTISNFDAAWNSHDIGRVETIWTGLKSGQAMELADFFKGNPESHVTDSCPPGALTVDGDTANWTCTETSTFKSGAKMVPHTLIVHFIFARHSGSWEIVGRQ
jgi:hypothetical protein